MVEKTTCVIKRDEFGNRHDYIEKSDDIVAYITISSPGPEPFGYRKVYIITRDGRAIWSTSSGAESFCGEVGVKNLESALLDVLRAPGTVVYTYKLPRPVNPYVFKLKSTSEEVNVEVEDYDGFKRVMPVLYSEMREYFKRYLNVELP